MKLQFTGEFDIDFDKELARINKLFKGGEKKRQLNIINLFRTGNFDQAIDAYNALPYSDKSECPEQEFVGEWFHNIGQVIMFSKFKTSGWKLINEQDGN